MPILKRRGKPIPFSEHLKYKNLGKVQLALLNEIEKSPVRMISWERAKEIIRNSSDLRTKLTRLEVLGFEFIVEKSRKIPSGSVTTKASLNLDDRLAAFERRRIRQNLAQKERAAANKPHARKKRSAKKKRKR
mgnify:CR=1 FL=1